ncbi:MAG: hypothetical protein RUDDFDWM_001720, partial [Candidatus Fervidibacterota bacterium]
VNGKGSVVVDAEERYFFASVLPSQNPVFVNDNRAVRRSPTGLRDSECLCKGNGQQKPMKPHDPITSSNFVHPNEECSKTPKPSHAMGFSRS